jgi:hypothetical protein
MVFVNKCTPNIVVISVKYQLKLNNGENYDGKKTWTYNRPWKELKLSHYTPRRLLSRKEVQLLLIHDLGTRWRWVVSVTPKPRFTPVERTPGTHCTGGWVCPRVGLDTEARGKILSSLSGIEPRCLGRPARSHTPYWLRYPAHIAHPRNAYLMLTPAV